MKKVYKICGNCQNSKPYDDQDFPLLCKKLGISIYTEDSCKDFIPKSTLRVTRVSNQDRLEKVRGELHAIANSYAVSGCGYIAVALRGISQTLHGILERLKEEKQK